MTPILIAVVLAVAVAITAWVAYRIVTLVWLGQGKGVSSFSIMSLFLSRSIRWLVPDKRSSAAAAGPEHNRRRWGREFRRDVRERSDRVAKISEEPAACRLRSA